MNIILLLVGILIMLVLLILCLREIRRSRHKEESPKALHDKFPEILEWQIGDELDVAEWYKPYSLFFKGVNDVGIIVQCSVTKDLGCVIPIKHSGDSHQLELQSGTLRGFSRVFVTNVNLIRRNTDIENERLQKSISESSYNTFLTELSTQREIAFKQYLELTQ